MKKKNKKNGKILLMLFLIPVLMLMVLIASYTAKNAKSYNYSEILRSFKNHEVTEYNLSLGSGKAEMKLKNGETVYYTVPSVGLFYEDIKDYVKEYNSQNPDAPMVYNLIKPVETSWFLNLLNYGLPILLLLFMIWSFTQRANIMNDMNNKDSRRSKMRRIDAERLKTTFESVAGVEGEKEDLQEIIDFLKFPKKYKDLGAKIPKGVLLCGAPGTGKTLLAKAVAGEAGVPFFSVSGSDFVELYVGMGAARVRELFTQAQKNSPCIVFIDEIDAVGRQRGAGLGGGHDEREQTLNQLLVEMDGFESNEGVIILAATNRPDILDHALLRPGRFDRQIFVDYPDMKAREEILKVHARNKPLGKEVDLKTIAKGTAGFTGADLKNVLNEAALLTARGNLNQIGMKEIEEATIKVVVGSEKKSKIMSEDDKKMTAYHEAGHAVAIYNCKTHDKVHEISIVPRGRAGGYTLHLPERDQPYVSKIKMLESIIANMGGKVAESIIFGEDYVTTGASSDIKNATKTAKEMVTKYGMSESLGPILYSSSDDELFIGRGIGHMRNYSEETASKIDGEIKNIITKCYEKTENILNENIKKLHQIAEFLLKNEKMSGEEFDDLMKSEA